MDKNNVSSRNVPSIDDDTKVIRSHISGTPTIAELRRRVWLRGLPKESTNKAGKKRQGTSN